MLSNKKQKNDNEKESRKSIGKSSKGYSSQALFSKDTKEQGPVQTKFSINSLTNQSRVSEQKSEEYHSFITNKDSFSHKISEKIERSVSSLGNELSFLSKKQLFEEENSKLEQNEHKISFSEQLNQNQTSVKDGKAQTSQKISLNLKKSIEESISEVPITVSLHQNSKTPQKQQRQKQQDQLSDLYFLCRDIKCPRHPTNNNIKQLCICLQNCCCNIQTEKQSNFDKIRESISGKSKSSRKSNSKKSFVHASKKKNGEKTTDNDDYNFQRRVLCNQCLGQQMHKGHLIISLTKFQQIVQNYHWASLQASKTVISKISQLQFNINHYLNQLSIKTLQVMTLGLTCNYEDHLPHVNIQTPLHSQTPDRFWFKSNNKNHVNHPKMHNQMVTPSALQTWREIFFSPHSSASSTQSKINKILSFKQQSISEQIQNINEQFSDIIAISVQNLEFINSHKQLIFNPDDMHVQSVGMTLNRNRLQYVAPECHEPSFYPQPQYPQSSFPNSLPQKQVSSCVITRAEEYRFKKPHYKLAFTELPLQSESSISFKIVSLAQSIMLGITTQEDHQTIGNKLFYENFEHLTYSISISMNGVKLHVKDHPQNNLTCCIKCGNILEFTLHHKNSTLTISQYESNTSKIRNILCTLPLGKSLREFYWPFVGLSGIGDVVELVQNIDESRVQISEIVCDSINRSQDRINIQVIDENFKIGAE